MRRLTFRWRKSGRSFVADVGVLSIVIDERGNLRDGHSYRVRSVFGWHTNGPWHESLQDAKAEAERLARRGLTEACKACEAIGGDR